MSKKTSEKVTRERLQPIGASTDNDETEQKKTGANRCVAMTTTFLIVSYIEASVMLPSNCSS